MKRGLPRALMTDNGAAMLADETVSGLNRLGVLHQTTLPYSPYQYVAYKKMWPAAHGSRPRAVPTPACGHIKFPLQAVEERHQLRLVPPMFAGVRLFGRCTGGERTGLGLEVGLGVNVGRGE
jgi:hypothetical protein